MARRSLLDEEESTDIDLSPMIDCIFILLIFFIVATVFVEERGVQANKPDSAAPAAIEEKRSLILQITAENEILVDDQEVALADVAGRVKARVGRDDETAVVVRAHERADHGTFVAVWDAALRGGAVTLTFQTVN
jgi:biopolymer transport protein ExbD